MLTDSELMGLVQGEISDAQGYNDDELSQNRSEALDYFYGRNVAAAEEGLSQAQSQDVADMTEAVMANVMPAFSGDTLVAFEPDGEEDRRQAILESTVVNNQIMERNRGFWNISQSIKDALLLRNAVMRCDVVETERVSSKKFTGIDDVSLALALMPQQENEEKELITIFENADDSKLLDATVSTTHITRKLEVVSVDPTLFLVNSNHSSIFLDDARFLAEVDFPTRTDLILEGYDKKMVMDLPSFVSDTNVDRLARRRDKNSVNDKGSDFDPSMQVVERHTSYFRVDRDEDGAAELHRIVSVQTHLLDDEIVDFQVYATGSAFVNPHEYNSISLFDKLQGIQDIKTKVLRQWLDNLDKNNNTTTIIADGAVNLEDAQSHRSGKVIRARSVEAVREMPIQDLGSSSQMFLQYADVMRSERGGASLDLQGAQMQLAGETAFGIDRQMGAKELLSALMARNLAETLIRSLYLLVHNTLRLKMPGEIVTQLGGEFVNSDPTTWVPRERVNVKAGLSIQERANMKMVLEQIIAKQTELFSSGMNGVLVSMTNYHNALTDWGRAAMVDNPERYFLDPESQAAQQASQEKQQAAQEQQAKEDETNEMLFGVQNQLEQMRIQLDKYEFDNELRFKYAKEGMNAEQVEAKILSDAALAIGKEESTTAE